MYTAFLSQANQFQQRRSVSSKWRFFSYRYILFKIINSKAITFKFLNCSINKTKTFYLFVYFFLFWACITGAEWNDTLNYGSLGCERNFSSSNDVCKCCEFIAEGNKWQNVLFSTTTQKGSKINLTGWWSFPSGDYRW